METILLIFLAGIALLFIEIYLTPGATIFGGIGLLAILFADMLAFQEFESPWNWLFAIASLIIVSGSLFIMINTLRSKQLSVQSEITSKVNELDPIHFQVGDVGETLTVLRPNGRAIFGEQITDVYSTGEYIEEGKKIEIVKRTSDKLFVTIK